MMANESLEVALLLYVTGAVLLARHIMVISLGGQDFRWSTWVGFALAVLIWPVMTWVDAIFVAADAGVKAWWGRG